jgi:thiamine-phosphate pyrophosphorylase
MPRIHFRLYLVTDRQQTAGRPLIPLIREAFEAGLEAVQLRERDLDTRELMRMAEELLQLARARRVPVLINDRTDLVMGLAAAGVHLRADSVPVSVTRRMLGPGALIGASAHSAEEVLRAESEGADFAVLGPIYRTSSKERYGAPIGLGPVEAAASRSRIPVFAIGGITAERVPEVRHAGAFGVAVISSVLSAPSVSHATQRLLSALREAP